MPRGKGTPFGGIRTDEHGFTQRILLAFGSAIGHNKTVIQRRANQWVKKRKTSAVSGKRQNEEEGQVIKE
jgi:hypothetical protein